MNKSGRSSVWLERVVWADEAVGLSPTAQTKYAPLSQLAEENGSNPFKFWFEFKMAHHANKWNALSNVWLADLRATLRSATAHLFYRVHIFVEWAENSSTARARSVQSS